MAGERFALMNNHQGADGGDRSRRPLDDLVLKGGDRDRALPTIRLGYVNPPRR
jgi:hypothetical protein